MEISLQQIGKRYKFEWIFRNVDFEFRTNGKYAILGANGSGKSTLIKILSGHLSPSKGSIQYAYQQQKVDVSAVYQYLSYAAPYIDLIEELTLQEVIDFHSKFKPFVNEMTTDDVVNIINLPSTATHKAIRFFSSGMKQRIKLSLAILSDSKLLLLDEPTTNLDKQGMDWYLDLINDYAFDKTIIVASNEERDYTFCDEILQIMNYKPLKKRK